MKNIIALLALLTVASVVFGFGLGHIAQILNAPSAPAVPEPWPEWERVDPPREDLECWVLVNSRNRSIVCSPKVVNPAL